GIRVAICRGRPRVSERQRGAGNAKHGDDQDADQGNEPLHSPTLAWTDGQGHATLLSLGTRVVRRPRRLYSAIPTRMAIRSLPRRPADVSFVLYTILQSWHLVGRIMSQQTRSSAGGPVCSAPQATHRMMLKWHTRMYTLMGRTSALPHTE